MQPQILVAYHVGVGEPLVFCKPRRDFHFGIFCSRRKVRCRFCSSYGYIAAPHLHLFIPVQLIDNSSSLLGLASPVSSLYLAWSCCALEVDFIRDLRPPMLSAEEIAELDFTEQRMLAQVLLEVQSLTDHSALSSKNVRVGRQKSSRRRARTDNDGKVHQEATSLLDSLVSDGSTPATRPKTPARLELPSVSAGPLINTPATSSLLNSSSTPPTPPSTDTDNHTEHQGTTTACSSPRSSWNNWAATSPATSQTFIDQRFAPSLFAKDFLKNAKTAKIDETTLKLVKLAVRTDAVEQQVSDALIDARVPHCPFAQLPVPSASPTDGADDSRGLRGGCPTYRVAAFLPHRRMAVLVWDEKQDLLFDYARNAENVRGREGLVGREWLTASALLMERQLEACQLDIRGVFAEQVKAASLKGELKQLVRGLVE